MTITRGDDEIEIEINGDYYGAEPDVGAMGGYVENICAQDLSGKPIELTETEEARAQEILVENAESDYDE